MADAPDLRAKLAQAIDELQKHKKNLDSLDDQVSAQIPIIEEALRSLKLGVRLSVEISTTYLDSSGIIEYDYLTFDKYKGEWKLFYEEITPEIDHEKSIPLSNCPRDLRATIIAKHLPLLLTEATKQLSERISERHRALSTANLVVETVNSVAKGR